MGPRSIDRGIIAARFESVPSPRASMGPRSIDRGIERAVDGPGKTGRASMGPRSIDRGIRYTARTCTACTCASMGPRSIDRGIDAVLLHAGPLELLQWGRDQLIAELGRTKSSSRTIEIGRASCRERV